MKHLVRLSRNTVLALLALTATFTVFVAAVADRGVVQKTQGKVEIRREPHGSLRAKVFQGKVPQYEFILDRETQQEQLTQSIDRADVYLMGKHEDALVIDDLNARKRYVLSMYDVSERLKFLPAMAGKPVFIKGYAMDLIYGALRPDPTK